MVFRQEMPFSGEILISVRYGQALTGSDFQLRVGSGRVNLKVGFSGTLGSGSDKFSGVNWPS